MSQPIARYEAKDITTQYKFKIVALPTDGTDPKELNNATPDGTLNTNADSNGYQTAVGANTFWKDAIEITDANKANINGDGTTGNNRIARKRSPADPCNISLTLHGIEVDTSDSPDDLDETKVKNIVQKLIMAIDEERDGVFNDKSIKLVQVNIACSD